MYFDTNPKKLQQTYSLLLTSAECFLRHRSQDLALTDRLDNLHTDANNRVVCLQDESALQVAARTGSNPGNLGPVRSSVLSSACSCEYGTRHGGDSSTASLQADNCVQPVDTHLSSLYFAVSPAISHCLRHFRTRP